MVEGYSHDHFTLQTHPASADLAAHRGAVDSAPLPTLLIHSHSYPYSDTERFGGLGGLPHAY